MRILHSHQVAAQTAVESVEKVMGRVSAAQLKEWVGNVSVPRHFMMELAENRRVGEWIAETLRGMGYVVSWQGHSRNVVASSRNLSDVVLVAAHYDSVPECPGADDNGSAVAAMLGCAVALAGEDVPVMFVAFNREEEGFIGSSEFVDEWQPPRRIICAHVLEMLGYASSAQGSQKLPTGLPIRLRETGDFLGLLANGDSAEAMELVVRLAHGCVPELPVTGLEVVPGAERVFPVLARSDHVPFWEAGMASLMWTDTAEFRNPNYHKASDTPETLDYEFLGRITKLLAATTFTQAKRLMLPG